MLYNSIRKEKTVFLLKSCPILHFPEENIVKFQVQIFAVDSGEKRYPIREFGGFPYTASSAGPSSYPFLTYIISSKLPAREKMSLAAFLYINSSRSVT